MDWCDACCLLYLFNFHSHVWKDNRFGRYIWQHFSIIIQLKFGGIFYDIREDCQLFSKETSWDREFLFLYTSPVSQTNKLDLKTRIIFSNESRALMYYRVLGFPLFMLVINVILVLLTCIYSRDTCRLNHISLIWRGLVEWIKIVSWHTC